MIINWDLNIRKSTLETLCNVKIVNGELDLWNCKNLVDLGDLERVVGTITAEETNITSLGKLKIVRGNVFLINCVNLTSLGNLQIVYGYLNLYGCKNLKDFGKLKAVIGKISIGQSGITNDYIFKNKKEYLFGGESKWIVY